ncbi:replication initiation factor domain-containing protein [Lactococcus garvieae]|uniref:replication initiation factor domain-containing protein n=1 Tax=Lactococcus garvieae TaxID=1363 RepID=UPI0032B47480
MDVKSVRKGAHVTQQFMSDVLGISLSYYRKIEKGIKPLTPELKEKIKMAFFKRFDSHYKIIATIDYVNIRFQTLNVNQVIKEVLGLKIENFHLNDMKRYNYPFFLNYGHINVYYHDKDPKAGVLIEMSGQACRELEYEFEYHQKKKTWYDFFSNAIDYGLRKAPENENFVKVTRFDLALDEQYNEKEGNFDLFSLLSAARDGRWNGRKKSYAAILGGRRTAEGLVNDGLSLYFGSKRTHLFFRFYEKDYERAEQEKVSVESVRDLYGLKNRYEIVMRKEISNAFVERFVNENFNFAEEGVKLINDNLTFYDKEGNLDMDWYKLMGTMNAYHFTVQPEEPDVNSMFHWFENGGPASTYLLLSKYDEMMGDSRLQEIIESAEITERNEKILEQLELIKGG